MQHLNIFEMSYEGDSYLVGTRDEILKAHNEWLESSGNFEKEEIKTYWGNDLFDVKGFWDLDLIYTVTQDQWDNESISKWRKEV